MNRHSSKALDLQSRELTIVQPSQNIKYQIGWSGRDRTCDAWINSPLPYHLATLQHLLVAGAAGLEPAIRGFKVHCLTNLATLQQLKAHRRQGFGETISGALSTELRTPHALDGTLTRDLRSECSSTGIRRLSCAPGATNFRETLWTLKGSILFPASRIRCPSFRRCSPTSIRPDRSFLLSIQLSERLNARLFTPPVGGALTGKKFRILLINAISRHQPHAVAIFS